MNKKYFSSICVTVLLFSGCSSSRPTSLITAESKLAAAKNDPFILKNSPLALAEAESTTYKAEMMWREDHDKSEVNRLAQNALEQIENAKLMAGKNATADMAEKVQHSQELLNNEKEVAYLQRQAIDREKAHYILLEELRAANEQDLAQKMIVSLNNDLLFEVDKTDLKSGAERNLLPIIEFLKTHPRQSVTIEGHTDSSGDPQYNKRLSELRALSVLSFLKQQGVAPSKITAIGLGENYPVAANSTNAGRLQNRRVDILISPADRNLG